MEVDFSLEQLHNFSLEGRNESVVAAYVVGGSLGGNSSQVLVLTRKEDLLEPRNRNIIRTFLESYSLYVRVLSLSESK